MTVSRSLTAEASALPVRGLTEAVTVVLTEAHWQFFSRYGFLALGPICEARDADALRRRAVELGVVELRDRFSEPALLPFLELLHHPLMHELAAHVYGPRAPVMVFGADVMPPGDGGPWRQGAAALEDLDRDELVHVVVGLGERPAVDVLDGSHRLGLLDGAATAGEVARRAEHVTRLEIEAGHGLLLHRWLLHRVARAGARVELWFVDGRARSVVSGYPELPLLTGSVDRAPYPCVRLLERELAALREIVDRCPP